MSVEGKARKIALRYLSRREYSQQEMSEKLVSKGIERIIADAITKELVHDNLINDVRFTQELVRVRMIRGYGPLKIKFELKQRGVSEEMASQCLSDIEVDWASHARLALERKFRQQPVEDYKEWAKRANYLRGRGFTSEHVQRSLGSYS